MKVMKSAALAAVWLCAAAAFGADDEPAGEFRLGATVAFNISARFTGLGGFVAPPIVGPGGTRTYEDGFVNPDASGIADGKTWFWGYGNASQVGNSAVPPTVAGTTLSMNSSSAMQNFGTPKVDGDPMPGVDLSYLYRLGRFDSGSWGLSFGANYTLVTIKDQETLVGDVSRTTDTYAAGIALPPAPYAGTSAGTGGGTDPRIPLLPASTTTTTVTGGAIDNGLRRLDGDLFTLRLGPYVRYKLGAGVSLEAGGGFALGIMSSEFQYNEAITIPSMNPVLQPGVSNTQTFAGSARKVGILPGGYGDLRLVCRFTPQWSGYLGGRFQYLGNFSQDVNGHSARVELGRAVFAEAGIGYSF